MTYLIQIVVGVVIAAGAGLAFYWKRIKRYFQKKSSSEASPSNTQADDADAGETFTADMLQHQSESEHSESK